MKHYESSQRTNTNVDQAGDSVNRLHRAVSQAASQPNNEQLLQQAYNSLEHADKAVRQAPGGSIGGQGVELAEEMLDQEKLRLAKVQLQHNRK